MLHDLAHYAFIAAFACAVLCFILDLALVLFAALTALSDAKDTLKVNWAFLDVVALMGLFWAGIAHALR